MVISSFLKSDFNSTETYQTLFDKGQLRFSARHYKEALTYFDRAITVIPYQADPNTWYQRGEVLAHLARYNEALCSFDQALALQPEHQQAWAFRGAVLIYLEQYAEALKSCNRALTLQPNDAETWVIRGAALHYLKRYKQAYASFDKALSIEPELPSQQEIQSSLFFTKRFTKYFIKRFMKQSRMQFLLVRRGRETIGGKQTIRRRQSVLRRLQTCVCLTGWQISIGLSILLLTAIVLVELIPSLQRESYKSQNYVQPSRLN